ncbi:polynucleotide phosphorylase [Hathewaya histolytica]|uniref:Polynucleotide phosphorylase n=1 Tax=Hathewaya histolytica TaxID=1498 RepID=A0A4U9RTS8_HATHI|nr:polynucleotide phosphorylase [Hathewaya histolytica]VTQ95864.1 polynucleotide phosphorylase [Hathewaya histolytica]
MDNNFTNSNNQIKYANLKETEEKRLKELESQFNSEFGTDYYLMIMKEK